MKITKRQLRRIVREGLSAGQKSDFRTVYDALWELYMSNPDVAHDQEAKERTVEEHGWVWDEYMKESERQLKEMEEQLYKNLQDQIDASQRGY